MALPGELETNEDMEKSDSSSFPALSPDRPNDLIDWALSHIPKRDGPRRHRHKNRMEQRMIIKRANDQVRIKNVRAARERQLKRNDAQSTKAAKFVAEGADYRKKLEEKRSTLYSQLGIEALVQARLDALRLQKQ